MMRALSDDELSRLLREDAPYGDLTTQSLVLAPLLAWTVAQTMAGRRANKVVRKLSRHRGQFPAPDRFNPFSCR